ncbi:hypothetical protein HYE10_00675 [Mycoplasmopsis bovis]|nr:hypothetical protein HYE10_00675 [Mycoplasmopsis bovis]
MLASCKNNETKEPKKEPEMDAPIAPPTDPGKNNETKESKKEPETDTPIAHLLILVKIMKLRS